MKIRGLIAAVVVLAGLTGALYWSNSHPPADTAKAPADTPPKILSINQDDIIGLAITNIDGGEVALKKDGNDWRITAPQSLAADPSAVAGIISPLQSLDAQRVVEDKATDLAQYGLAQPTLAVRITEKNNQTRQLLMGDTTPTGNGVYAKVDSDPRVFTITSFNKTNFDKGLNDLRDKRLITAEPDKITRVELTTPHETLEFGRDKDQWQILKPELMRADGSQVSDLVRALTDAKMDLSAKDSETGASAFARSSPVATVKITTASGTQELQVRKNKDTSLAKASIVPGVYKVPGTLSQQLDKKFADFRNKKLFDFGPEEPNKMEVHDGAKAYFFTRSGDDWWAADGKKLDADKVEQLVGKLRDLQATDFAKSGFTTPALELTVNSNDGKRTEKVLVSKAASGSDYIAERQDDCTLYVLSESAVADLQSAASDVKPAAAPKK